jgi:hypothetical protein
MIRRQTQYVLFLISKKKINKTIRLVKHLISSLTDKIFLIVICKKKFFVI